MPDVDCNNLVPSYFLDAKHRLDTTRGLRIISGFQQGALVISASTRRYKILATAIYDTHDTVFSRVAALEHSDTHERDRESVLGSQLDSIVALEDRTGPG